jgi:hypothetical protein
VTGASSSCSKKKAIAMFGQPPDFRSSGLGSLDPLPGFPQVLAAAAQQQSLVAPYMANGCVHPSRHGAYHGLKSGSKTM